MCQGAQVQSLKTGVQHSLVVFYRYRQEFRCKSRFIDANSKAEKSKEQRQGLICKQATVQMNKLWSRLHKANSIH